MKKMFTMIITAVLLTANLSVGTVARAEDIECNHNFVEETTIVHHDAEYATKTIWAKLDWFTFTGENKIGDGTNQFDLGTSAGTSSWYHEDGRTMYCEDTIDTYDLVSYYYDYIDYLDYPDEAFLQRITIDNYADYGMTYEEFCDQTDEYNFFGHLNPEFNPELDELVQFSWDVIGDGNYKYDNEFYYNNVTSLDDLLNGTDSSSKITGSYGMVYGYGDDGAINPYWPILQYQIPITEAYDEEVTQYVCSECGQEGTKNADGTISAKPACIRGDVNGDGKVDVADVVLLQRWLLGDKTAGNLMPDWKTADLYEDERLDVFDICLLKRLLIYGEI